jgi:hypothetical protein
MRPAGVDVPLASIAEFEGWIKREAPSFEARLVVAEFLIATAERPWEAPSAPIEDLCERPMAEVREATLRLANGTYVQVWYRHTYANGYIDVVAVTGPR